MLWNKVKIVLACILAAGTIALTLAGVMARQSGAAGSGAGQPGSARQASAGPAGQAQPPVKRERPPDRIDQDKPEPKRFSFEMRNQPWANVFEWFCETSGLPLICNSRPTGTFTFIPPGRRQYSLDEITDLINEALLAQKYVLIRRTASFTVLSLDDKIDPGLLPRVPLDELDKRGRTELVTTVVPLTQLNAKEIGPDVKKMMSPFGEVVILERANQLILQDTVANLRLIRQMLIDVESREAKKKEQPKIKAS